MTITLEQARLTRLTRRRITEMPISKRRCDAATRGSLQKAMLNQEWLVHLFDRRRILADCRTDVVQPNGTALKFLDDRLEDYRIHVIEPELVDVDHSQELRRNAFGDDAIRLHLRIIANATQQAVGNAWRAARATGDLVRAAILDLDVQDHRRPRHDLLEVINRIVVQSFDDPEPRPHRRRQHSESG